VLDPVRGRTFDIEVPLSAVPEAEQCGWCKDKFGLSWQIVPTVMDTMMAKGTREPACAEGFGRQAKLMPTSPLCRRRTKENESSRDTVKNEKNAQMIFHQGAASTPSASHMTASPV
jgi:hypothetical protein